MTVYGTFKISVLLFANPPGLLTKFSHPNCSVSFVSFVVPWFTIPLKRRCHVYAKLSWILSRSDAMDKNSGCVV